MSRLVAALVALALLPLACGDGDEASSPAIATTTPTDTVAAGLPDPVADTRAAILAGAEAGDYEQLRDALEPEVFLSDYGFGQDPVGRWEKRGAELLRTMEAVLRMRYFVRETNEGTLYQWPTLTPDSSAEDMTPAERDLFLTFMDEEELEAAFNPDYGYTAPRLGILADGTWWFFITEQGP